MAKYMDLDIDSVLKDNCKCSLKTLYAAIVLTSMVACGYCESFRIYWSVPVVGQANYGMQPNESAILLFPLLYIYGISACQYVHIAQCIGLVLYLPPSLYHCNLDLLQFIVG